MKKVFHHLRAGMFRGSGWPMIREIGASTLQSMILLMIYAASSAMFSQLNTGPEGVKWLIHMPHSLEGGLVVFLWPFVTVSNFFFSVSVRLNEDRHLSHVALAFDIAGRLVMIATHNISSSGACIHLPTDRLAVNQVLPLSHQGKWSAGVVCWVNERTGKAGIKFLQCIA